MTEKYKGMTVNERLYVSGLMPAFDKAIKEKNIEEAKSILYQVELKEDNIKKILESLGL